MLSAVIEPAASLQPARLLADYAVFVESLSCGAQAKRLRRHAAQGILSSHPDLWEWMRAPVLDRLADVRRLDGWPFLSWCFATGRLTPDLDLLAGKGKGGHFTLWARVHAADEQRARAAAEPFGWCTEWTTRIVANALPLACMTRARTLGELTAEDLDGVEAAIEASPVLTSVGRGHLIAQHRGLRSLCYQLRLTDTPPVHANTRTVPPIERAAGIRQLEIRRVAERYLNTIAATVQPKTVAGRAASLQTFADWLAAAHPEVGSLRHLTRTHLEGFLAFHAQRGWRGRVARDRRISVRHHARTVVDLRAFFDDVAAWGWAERPNVLLLHRSDIPRLPQPLPRALPPDVDAALTAAVTDLDDAAARCGIVLLRGTGLRLGELLDLELDCLWTSPGTVPG